MRIKVSQLNFNTLHIHVTKRETNFRKIFKPDEICDALWR